MFESKKSIHPPLDLESDYFPVWEPCTKTVLCASKSLEAIENDPSSSSKKEGAALNKKQVDRLNNNNIVGNNTEKKLQIETSHVYKFTNIKFCNFFHVLKLS